MIQKLFFSLSSAHQKYFLPLGHLKSDFEIFFLEKKLCLKPAQKCLNQVVLYEKG